MTTSSIKTTKRVAGRIPRRALEVFGALGVIAALGVAPALAAWSTTGTATAGAVARSLVTPGQPTVVVGTPPASTLVVSGTMPVGQVPGTTYTLMRDTITAVPCTFPASGPYSCPNTGLSSGTAYSYTVVATLNNWTATSVAGTGTTQCPTPRAFTASASNTTPTAGSALNVTLTAKDCTGATDVAYTGSKVITFSGPGLSPSGKAPSYPASVSFVNGVGIAPITLYEVQSTAITATQGSRTGTSASITVTAAEPKNFVLSAVTSKGAAVTVTCPALTDPATARSCTASNPNQNGNHDWVATANLLDSWGNPATTPTARTVTATRSGGTSTATIAAGAGATPTPLTISISNGETVSIAFTATGISTLTVTNAT